MKKIKEIYEPYMTRPTVYMTFTRFILALCITLLADFFLSPRAGRPLKQTLFSLTAIIFAALAAAGWDSSAEADDDAGQSFQKTFADVWRGHDRLY